MPKYFKTRKSAKTIKELEINPVRDYLKTVDNLLSYRTISKSLKIKKSKVLYYCENSNFIRPIEYGENGCYRRNVKVFCHV